MSSDFEELTEEHFDTTLKTNLYGYFHMAQAAVPHMKPGSAIINSGSVTGIEGSKQLVDYSMTKGGIHAFTRALSGNLIEKGIRVNCVAPGPVWTPLNPSDKQAERRFEIRRRHADETAGAAGGDRARLCVPRLAALLQLHHRRDIADHRRLLSACRPPCLDHRGPLACDGGSGDLRYEMVDRCISLPWRRTMTARWRTMGS